MKKLLFSIMMCLFCITTTSAQVVDNGGIRDNWYISGSVGTTIWSNSNSWCKPHDILVDIAIGKDITPIFGLEVEVETAMNAGGKCFFDETTISANLVTNITRMFADKRKFETSLVTGAGWYHTYGRVYNNAIFNIGIEEAYNINDNWAITLTPEYNVVPKSTPTAQRFNIMVGTTYTFNSKRGGFPKVRVYDDMEIEILNSEINSLRARNSEISTPVVVSKTDTVTIYVDKREYISPTIQFNRGSENVSRLSYSNLRELARFMSKSGDKYIITGYASEEGNDNFNRMLSYKRATSVYNKLVEFGVSKDNMVIDGKGSTAEFGDREFNRIVIISKQ